MSLLPLSTNRYKCTHYAWQRNYRLSRPVYVVTRDLSPATAIHPPYCPSVLEERSGLFSAVRDGLSLLSTFLSLTGILIKSVPTCLPLVFSLFSLVFFLREVDGKAEKFRCENKSLLPRDRVFVDFTVAI